MKFNEKLFELRKQKGLSQEELADKLNVSRQTISKWEMGQTIPDMEKLVVLSQYFNISIDELVGKEKIDSKKEGIKKDKKKHKIVKILLIILFIYLFCSIYKLIVLSIFSYCSKIDVGKNYWIGMTYQSNEMTNYIFSSRTKKDNIYLETTTKEGDEKPYQLTYIDLNNRIANNIFFDEGRQVYILSDPLSGFSYKEKEEFFDMYEGNDYINEVSNPFKNKEIRLFTAFYPLSFVDLIFKRVITIIPFNITSLSEFNDEFLLYRTIAKEWGTGQHAIVTYNYDTVQEHFKDRILENPVESGEYEIVKQEEFYTEEN